MGRFLGRLGGHEGYAARKLADGSIVASRTDRVGEFAAFVAACACPDQPGEVTWLGPGEYPPTEAGERAAVDEWEQLHARSLLAAPRLPAAGTEVTAMLARLDALTVQSPVAMLAELDRVQRRTEELLTLAVSHSRLVGASWAQIADRLGLSEETARRRFS